MTQALDLLNSLSDEEIAAITAQPDPEGHIIVGGDRNIIVPSNLKRLGVQYDHNMETVTFDCPRYWDKRDMSKMAVYINYMRSDGYADKYPADNVTADGEVMHFDWTISRNVTEVPGAIGFLICVMKTDGEGNEERHWNSELCNDCYISQGMETEEHPALQYPDEVTQLLLRMSAVEQINVQASEMGQLLADTQAAAAEAEASKDIALDASGYIKNSYAPAIKGNVAGEIIRVDDVSPIEHDVKCRVHGKNLANINNVIRSLSVNLSYTEPELHIIKTNDTEKWSNIYIGIGDYTNFVGKTLTMSLDNEGTYTWSVLLVGTNSKGELIKEVGGTTAKNGHVAFTVTIPKMLDAELLSIRIVSGDNKVTTGEESILKNIQVEEGTIATAYEPYIDPTTVTVCGCSKNLAKTSYSYDVTTNGVNIVGTKNSSEITINGTPEKACSYKIMKNIVLSPGTYTASVNGLNVVDSSNDRIYVCQSDDGVVIKNYIMTDKPQTFSITDVTSVDVELVFSANSKYSYMPVRFQIEKGDVATGYEPHVSSAVAPSSDGTCTVTSISPTMTLLTGTPGVTIEAEYNRDTTKMFESYVLTDEAKSEIASIVENDMAEVLASLNEYAESLIGGDS